MNNREVVRIITTGGFSKQEIKSDGGQQRSSAVNRDVICTDKIGESFSMLMRRQMSSKMKIPQTLKKLGRIQGWFGWFGRIP